LPIEPALLPLVDALKTDRARSEKLLVGMPSKRDMARGLRRWLMRAGVDRHELHHPTPTTKPLRFHDLRATGITWMAVRGDDPLRIMQRAGHEEFETTQEYIRLAEDLRSAFGQVFPPLPPELFERRQLGISITSSDHAAVTSGKDVAFSGADGTRTRGLRRDRPAL